MMMPQERMQQQVAGESQTEYEKKVTWRAANTNTTMN